MPITLPAQTGASRYPNISGRGKDKVFNFISEHRAGSLGTANAAGVPHVAIVYCMVKHDLSLYFSTRVEGRKFQNIMVNPTVALTFLDELGMATIQLMGQAERVQNLELEQEVLHDLITYRYGDPNWPVPPVKLFEQGSTNELAIIKVTPYEMTYANFETSITGRYKPFFTKIL
jgi:general stress protein 26